MHINYTLFSFRWSLNFFKPINPRQSPRVITTTNRTKFNIIINKWELRVKSSNLFQARENATDQVGIGCSSAFD